MPADSLSDLVSRIERYAGVDGIHATPIPRLSLIRVSCPTEPLHALHEPALCLVVQGHKQVMLGKHVYPYGVGQYLAVSVDVPVIGQVVEASAAAPYLCLRLDLDAATLGALILEAGLGEEGPDPGPGVSLSDASPELLEAAARLLRLVESPREAAILAPLAEKELLYRALLGGQTTWLRQIAFPDSHLRRVSRAIEWLKRSYRQPFSLPTLAGEAGMSTSALHHHFKALTAMSPLQYQKQLRLQEARRLILARSTDAAGAGHSVGYDSPSQFSREYHRLFGAPPQRDVERLRQALGTQADMTLAAV
jgi:AraC-like DNA-binding protein